MNMRWAMIVNGVVTGVILWDGDLTNFQIPEGTTAINLPDDSPVGPGYTYDGTTFSAPPLTPEELRAAQNSKLQGFTWQATAQKNALTVRIGTLNDAIDLGMATDAEVAELPVRNAQLKAWKTYAVLLGRVTSQPGWYTVVTWPDQPTDGMDLTVSASAPQTS